MLCNFYLFLFKFQISNDASLTRVINKFCGVRHNEHQNIVTSSGNRAYVHFFSDVSYAGRGFRATYKSIPASKKLMLLISEEKLFDILY